ncbi:MAG: putative 4-hydroxybenzoate polyprenyltransferase [Leptospiraceae bacterium]|nr:putative 4-hydroxybenzoate polyprenyltransferase [Leptospiraceae bacterium]MDW8307501.1 UbiA-like polyprenyltransferase [Leptospiraceae bacterium]
MKSLWGKIRQYAALIKLSHTLFALPFALSAIVLLWDQGMFLFSWPKLVYIVLAFASFRGFAMAFNRISDAFFDAQNPRTRNREIPMGVLSKKEVLFFALLLLFLGFFFAYLLNPLAVKLAPLAAFLLVFYSYTKRFTYLCHFWLGAAIGQAPLAVDIALIGNITANSLFLFFILLFYIAGFDILYAQQDEEFDRKAGLYSIPARWGIKKAQLVALVSHIVMLVLLVGLGYFRRLGVLYYIFLSLIAVLLYLEHREIGLLGQFQKEKIPTAFFNYNALVSIFLFTGLFLDTLVRHYG